MVLGAKVKVLELPVNLTLESDRQKVIVLGRKVKVLGILYYDFREFTFTFYIKKCLAKIYGFRRKVKVLEFYCILWGGGVSDEKLWF